MRNDGVQYQKSFEAMCKAQGFHVFRLRDSKDVNGLNKTKGGRRLAMFPCPADFLVAQPGSMVLTEVKSTQNKTSFPYANIEPAQRSAACICAVIGAPYNFWIYSIALEKWFILPAAEFATDIKAGKKSRKFEELISVH